MNIYEKLAKHPTFRIDDVFAYCGNLETARSAVKRLMAKGRVLKIRNNLYTCVSPEHGGPVASRYQVANAITPTSYVSHHSAMAYHGYTNQVVYEIIVSSATRFSDFEFDGYTYRFARSLVSEGVVSQKFNGGVKVTSLERTLADCLKDMGRFSGLDEIMEMIDALPHLNEEDLLHYMDLYSNRFLYQKAGYLLWPHRKALGLSDNFFVQCHDRIGNVKRYLADVGKGGKFVGRWNLIVPTGRVMFGMEGFSDAAI